MTISKNIENQQTDPLISDDEKTVNRFHVPAAFMSSRKKTTHTGERLVNIVLTTRKHLLFKTQDVSLHVRLDGQFEHFFKKRSGLLGSPTGANAACHRHLLLLHLLLLLF